MVSVDARQQSGDAAAIVADFRSDTLTRPTAGMRAAMARAEVGDDVYGEDPTIKALEAAVAERLGKAAGLFLPSATQSNLCAMLSHCARGEEVLAGKGYHVVTYEAGGGSVLGGLVQTVLPVENDGGVDLQALRGAIKPDDQHFPVTRLLSLENTVSGRAVPPARMAAAAGIARDAGLSVHLDGARIFNAATALDRPVAEIAAVADSVTVCLSKGLGAPAGAVLCGSPELLARAHRWRKMLGGGMRQAGVLAAAGLYALEHHVARLAEDHARARRLADALAAIDGIEVDPASAQSNMLFIRLEDPSRAPAFRESLAAAGVVLAGFEPWCRMVLHLDIDDAGVDRTIEAATAFFARG